MKSSKNLSLSINRSSIENNKIKVLIYYFAFQLFAKLCFALEHITTTRAGSLLCHGVEDHGGCYLLKRGCLCACVCMQYDSRGFWLFRWARSLRDNVHLLPITQFSHMHNILNWCPVISTSPDRYLRPSLISHVASRTNQVPLEKTV